MGKIEKKNEPVIAAVLKEEKRLLKLIKICDKYLDTLPIGSLQKKHISNRDYIYMVYREDGKVKTQYMGVNDSIEVEKMRKKIELRNNYRDLKKNALLHLKKIQKILSMKDLD